MRGGAKYKNGDVLCCVWCVLREFEWRGWDCCMLIGV